MGRAAGRRRCGRRMEERGRQERGGTKRRQRDTRADGRERVDCRAAVRLRIAAAEAVLSRRARRLR